MRILILTGGSRGDVEPFAALARAAVDRGGTDRALITLESLLR